jgi:hypothetical protein
MKRTLVVLAGTLLALVSSAGCARNVTIHPDSVPSRNQQDWDIRRVPGQVPEAAPPPAPSAADRPAPAFASPAPAR